MNPKLNFVLAIAAVLAAANAARGAVLDTDGQFLFPGVSYYVLPVFRGRGGGLTLRGRGSNLCPLDVVQAQSELDKGVPVRFSNWRPRVGFVPESEDLNIMTDAATICVQPTFWWIDEFDKERKQWFVTTGGKPRGFGEESFKSFFKIEKSSSGEQDYKFVFCPQFCDFCKPLCSDVGIFFDENGVRRLALSDVPFEVRFQKAGNETESSTMIM